MLTVNIKMQHVQSEKICDLLPELIKEHMITAVFINGISFPARRLKFKSIKTDHIVGVISYAYACLNMGSSYFEVHILNNYLHLNEEGRPINRCS